MTGSARLKRLRWACRRGMKELDFLLEGFLERESQALEEGGWPAFETLLECEDDQLWDWFQGRTPAPTHELRKLVDAIRR